MLHSYQKYLNSNSEMSNTVSSLTKKFTFQTKSNFRYSLDEKLVDHIG